MSYSYFLAARISLIKVQPGARGRAGIGKGGSQKRMIEHMAQVHMTEAELARDIASVLDRVQSGTEIVIEHNAQPIAVVRPAQPKRRKLSEIVDSLSAQSTATIDPDFASDVQVFVESASRATSPA